MTSKIEIREMTVPEVEEFFGDDRNSGLVAIDEGGDIVGQLAWNTSQSTGDLYFHSLFCDDRHPDLLARIMLKARSIARAHGFKSAICLVDKDNPHLLRLVERERAYVETLHLRIPL